MPTRLHTSIARRTRPKALWLRVKAAEWLSDCRFDPPSVVIEGDKITATAENLFIDYWERVQ